jgi:hypothetical protein
MRLTENSILVPPSARGEPAAFHALGHQVTIAGPRQEFRPHESLGLLHRIRKLFAGLATGVEGRSNPATNLPGAKTANWSSVTTPSGPWVYTVVPWED